MENQICSGDAIVFPISRAEKDKCPGPFSFSSVYATGSNIAVHLLKGAGSFDPVARTLVNSMAQGERERKGERGGKSSTGEIKQVAGPRPFERQKFVFYFRAGAVKRKIQRNRRLSSDGKNKWAEKAVGRLLSVVPVQVNTALQLSPTLPRFIYTSCNMRVPLFFAVRKLSRSRRCAICATSNIRQKCDQKQTGITLIFRRA